MYLVTQLFLYRLVFPNRTFYFVADSPSDAKEWIDHFQWKIVSFNPFLFLFVFDFKFKFCRILLNSLHILNYINPLLKGLLMNKLFNVF